MSLFSIFGSFRVRQGTNTPYLIIFATHKIQTLHILFTQTYHEASFCSTPLTPSLPRHCSCRTRDLKKGGGKCDLWTKKWKNGKSSKGKGSYNFNRIATFPVCSQLDADCNTDTETAAEIVTVSGDLNTLIYSDSPMGVIGFVDITDATSPLPLGTLDVGGEPASVSVWNDSIAVVGVNTSEDYVNTSGLLVAVDIATQTILKSWDLGGQPDTVAVSPDGKYIVVAIENQRDEDLGEGIPPQVSC